MACHCTCDNNIDDYDVDELLEEINYRLGKDCYGKMKLIAVDELAGIRRAIEQGNAAEATWLFDSALFPKWKELKACEKAWKAATAPPPPPPRVGLWQHSEPAHSTLPG